MSAGESLAAGLHASFTLGGGQFCTKPGIVFLETLRRAVPHQAPNVDGQRSRLRSCLSSTIAETYGKGLQARSTLQRTEGQRPAAGFAAQTALLELDYSAFAANPDLHHELFGPSTLLVTGTNREQMLAAARALEGHLTATILRDRRGPARIQGTDLYPRDQGRGRVIFNGYPTGVEITHAMVHGRPLSGNIRRSLHLSRQPGHLRRFARPVCYQNLPQDALPAELTDDNPRRILRLWNGAWVLAIAECNQEQSAIKSRGQSACPQGLDTFTGIQDRGQAWKHLLHQTSVDFLIQVSTAILDDHQTVIGITGIKHG